MWEIIDEPMDGYEFLDGIFATMTAAHNYAEKECFLTYGEYEVVPVTVYNVAKDFEQRFVIEVPL